MTVIIDGTAGITFPVTAGSASAVQASSGRVLQVVTSNYSTGTSTTSSTYTDLGMSASITPSSSSNKVLVIVSVQGLYLPNGGNSNDNIQVKLLRGSTDINIMAGQINYRGQTSPAVTSNTYGIYTDSPATTSSTTYKLQWRTENSRPINMNVGGETSTFTLMEISA
jgi:hypothetical protein